jgi:hypothetical protein
LSIRHINVETRKKKESITIRMKISFIVFISNNGIMKQRVTVIAIVVAEIAVIGFNVSNAERSVI